MQLPLFIENFPADHEALERCLRADVVAVDVETETRWPGTGPRNDYGLSYSADVIIIALAWHEHDEICTTSVIAPFDDMISGFVRELFGAPKTIVAHNAVFDIRQLSKLSGGIIPQRIWDTMAMARLLHPAVRMHYRLLNVADTLEIAYSAQQAEMKEWRGKLHEIPKRTAAAYAEEDVRLALAIYEKQQTIPADPELVDWEIRAMRQYCRMAAEGIRLNFEYIEKRRAELEQIKMEAAARLADDGLIDPDSPKSRVRYLYQTKGIPIPEWDPDEMGYFTRAGYRRLRKSDSPHVTLDDLSARSHIIEAYGEADSPYAEQLKDLATYSKADWLVSMLDSLVEHASLDGRVHSLITIATDTGRRASSHPAMQNWKMPDMAGVARADDGFTLVEIDYSNAENVMAALIAGDDNLAAACLTDDFHSAMGVRYFGERWEQADTEERKRLRGMSKRISYGTAYGMGARSLARNLNVSLDEAYAFLRAKDTAFPNLARLKAKAEQKVRAQSKLKLWSGRPVALDSAFVAWNYVCQGGVAEMLKRAIVLISEGYEARGMRSRVALDIHDALVIEVKHEEWDKALELASEMMSNIIPETLQARTTPPVVWIAKPNAKENQNKWGKNQWHPAVGANT